MSKHDSDYSAGQRDGANNHYDPPVPIDPLTELITDEQTLSEWRECNDAYSKGWSNGYKQR